MNQPKKRNTIFQYKKKSTIGKIPMDPIEQLKQDYDITSEVILKIQRCFRRYDTFQINAIQWYEVDDVFRDMDFDITDSVRDVIIDTMKQYDARSADFTLVCRIYAEIRKLLEQEAEEAEQMDTINAFVAMGGNVDRTGFVQKNIIIDIIKNDFQLNFDIEGYLEKQGLGNQDELGYTDFFKIFDSAEEGKDLLSTYSQKLFEKKQIQSSSNQNNGEQEFNNFEVNYKDFEDWQKNQDELQQQQLAMMSPRESIHEQQQQ